MGFVLWYASAPQEIFLGLPYRPRMDTQTSDNTTDNKYTARCDEVAHEAFRAFLREKLDVKNLVICKEDPGNNPHYHYYFESDKNESAIKKARTRFDLIKPFKGNKYISISVLRGSKDEYMKYMCKGYNVSKPYSDFVKTHEPPRIVFRTIVDFPDEKIHELNQDFWKTYRELSKETNPKKKRNVTTWTQQLIEDCIRDAKKHTDTFNDEETKKWVAEYVVNYTCDMKKPFDKFILKRMYNQCICHVMPRYREFFRDDLVRELEFFT